MRWLYRIVARLKGCRHRWEEVEALTPTRYNWITHKRYDCGAGLRCKKCGDVKFVLVPREYP